MPKSGSVAVVVKMVSMVIVIMRVMLLLVAFIGMRDKDTARCAQNRTYAYRNQ